MELYISLYMYYILRQYSPEGTSTRVINAQTKQSIVVSEEQFTLGWLHQPAVGGIYYDGPRWITQLR